MTTEETQEYVVVLEYHVKVTPTQLASLKAAHARDVLEPGYESTTQEALLYNVIEYGVGDHVGSVELDGVECLTIQEWEEVQASVPD